MNKQELIERIEGLKNIFGNKCEYVKIDFMIELVSELDEPETGRADEAPRYVKNILARLRELPLHDREVWLKAIMGEFEQDFSHAKWREGYEQGKVEGMIEQGKVAIPQFVADWIEHFKKCSGTLYGSTVPYSYYGRAITDGFEGDVTETLRWICNNSETYARAWLDGYEVEKEKKYRVKVKGICGNHETLNREKHSNKWLFSDREENSLYGTHHTRKELEDAGFSEVFNSPLFEVEEVE